MDSNLLELLEFHMQGLHMSFLMSEMFKRGLITDEAYDGWLLAQGKIILATTGSPTLDYIKGKAEEGDKN